MYSKRSKSKSGGKVTPKTHLAKVQEAVEWRDSAKYDQTWSKLIKMYSNQYEYPELAAYEDVIAPNMVFSTVNVIVPSIAINYPKITVTSRREDSDDKAQIVEGVANYYWRHFNVHDEFRAMIKDFSIIGHGWLKTTWSFEEEEVDLTPDEWKQEVQRALTEINMAKMQAERVGETDISFPSERDIVDAVPTKKTVVTKDQPVVERISPFDLFVDPSVTRLKNARWIAQRIFMPIEVAKDKEEWSVSARNKLSPSAINRDKVDVLNKDEQRPKEADYVTIWEYYNLIDRTVCTFAENCDDWLKAPEEVPFPFDHPFVMVCNYDIPEKFYPIGDVETVAPLQQELAITRTQMINDRKRFRRMYMYRADMIGEDGVNALLSADDNAMIEVEGEVPFSDVIAPVATMSLPPEFYNQTAMILDDINMISGISEYQRGGVTEIRRTATEASMINDASNARSADKLSIIERAIGQVAEQVVQLAQENLTTEQVAKIVDEDGAKKWVPYDRDSISGEYDFEVEAGSTQPQNETFRRQSALQLMDTMAPFIQMQVVDPRKLAEHVMKNGFGIKDPDQFMLAAPQGAPMNAEVAEQPMEGEAPEASPEEMMAQGGMMPPEMMQGAMGAPEGMGALVGTPAGGPPSGLPPELLAQLPPELRNLPADQLMAILQQMQQGGGQMPEAQPTMAPPMM